MRATASVAIPVASAISASVRPADANSTMRRFTPTMSLILAYFVQLRKPHFRQQASLLSDNTRQ